MSEREGKRSRLHRVENRISSDKEKVPPFIEVLPQQQPKDDHVTETDPEELWFNEYILTPQSTRYHHMMKCC